MANHEEEVLNALTNDHAEGESDLMYEEDSADFAEGEDSFAADHLEGEAEMDGMDFDHLEEEDGAEAEEDAFVPALAAALSAESEDQFFGKLVRVIRKAAPIVGRIARVAAPILSAIPHPAAQVAARVAGLAGKLSAEAAEAGEGEDGVMLRAAEAAAEYAVQDRRARPVVVGLVSRQIAQNRAAHMPLAQRRKIVSQVQQAARILTRQGGPAAIRALPKIVAIVNRTADARGTPISGRLAVLRRSVDRIANRQSLLQRVSQVSPYTRQLLQPNRRGAGWTAGLDQPDGRYGRSMSLNGPFRITVTPM